MRIFVSIASYRDPQLVPTIQDCLAKARYPDRLRFGICQQRGTEEPPLERPDWRFRILDVDWRVSRGVCWARAAIMRLWEGERFYLQLDSHHRFVADWDAKLLRQAEQTWSSKPILGTYAPRFIPGEPDILEPGVLQMNFDRFTDEGVPLFRPGFIAHADGLMRPVRARFLSAHFLFTIGRFVAEVPYDPELYFIGEEISLAARAYTHGYDLFHPSEVIVWHEYTRDYRTKHWDDHVADRGIEKPWHERDAISKQKIARLLAEPAVGALAYGTARTLADYEAYAGLSFNHRKVQEYTRLGLEPPNPATPAGWLEEARTYRVRIDLDPTVMPALARADPAFWYVGFHDAGEQELYRQDAGEGELRELLNGGAGRVVIDREFTSSREPVAWTVWPFSRSAGWLERIRGAVQGQTSAPLLPAALPR